MTTPFGRVLAVSVVGLVAVLAAGCGGAVEENDQVVSDAQSTSAGLASPDPQGGGGAGTAGDDDRDDDANDPDARRMGSRHCNDHDRDGHRHHRHHKFKVLDAMDGKRDGHITIADLPAGLPDRLITRLHEIDTDGDGEVTWNEVAAWRRAHDDDDRR